MCRSLTQLHCSNPSACQSANAIEFSRTYKVIFIDTRTGGEELCCKYREGISNNNTGQMSLTARGLSINLSLQNARQFVRKSQKDGRNSQKRTGTLSVEKWNYNKSSSMLPCCLLLIAEVVMTFKYSAGWEMKQRRKRPR